MVKSKSPPPTRSRPALPLPGAPRLAWLNCGRVLALHLDEVGEDDFVEAGRLYRAMAEEERGPLIEAIAGTLAEVARREVVAQAIAYFTRADPEYGRRVAEAVARRGAW